MVSLEQRELDCLYETRIVITAVQFFFTPEYIFLYQIYILMLHAHSRYLSMFIDTGMVRYWVLPNIIDLSFRGRLTSAALFGLFFVVESEIGEERRFKIGGECQLTTLNTQSVGSNRSYKSTKNDQPHATRTILNRKIFGTIEYLRSSVS